ncbi:Mss4-like protein [Xylogone sp. PMI_703]|nr:Mss4-like protein [Xylogone sp. PMI_703]
MPSGSCACGKITYEYSGEPALTALCHCPDCQKWTGSANTTNVAVPTTAFKLLTGTPKAWTRKALAGKPHPHYFCGDCGSSLYSQPEGMAGTTLIKSGTLDNGASNINIAAELFTRNRKGFLTAIEGAQQAQTMV